MPRDDRDDLIEVPLPSSETDAERQRIRSSNDHDQRAERDGESAPHNRGYDEAAHGAMPRPEVENVIDED